MLNDGVITSDFFGKLNASMPIYSAEEPELTYKQYFFSNSLAISFFKSSRIFAHLS